MTVALGGISYCKPEILSDAGNTFLKGFVNHELLAFLGVVVTITLASAANLHIELNKLEELAERKFPETRRGVRLSAYSLLVLLAIGIAIVITKPYIQSVPTLSSLWNSAAIVVVVCNLLVLVDLTAAILAIPSARDIKKNNIQNDNGAG